MQNELKCPMCPICLDLLDDNNLISAFGCNTHLLCINCNNKCIENNIHKCPLCRARRINEHFTKITDDISEDDDMSEDDISEDDDISENDSMYPARWRCACCPRCIRLRLLYEPDILPLTTIYQSSFRVYRSDSQERQESVRLNTLEGIVENFNDLYSSKPTPVKPQFNRQQINRQNKQDWKKYTQKNMRIKENKKHRNFKF